MMDATEPQVVARLERTRTTINNFMRRTPGATLNDNHLCGLVDRYNDLKEQLTRVGGYQNPAWRAYCEQYGSDVRHDGYDLIV